MLSIKSMTDDPYAQTIQSFLAQCFPNAIDSDEALIDSLTTAFVTTSQNRYGPIPRPETLVAIRQVFRHWIALEDPIAVLSPWGSRKVGDGILDVAEIMALRQLEALNNRVKKFYSPGITVNLGIEDLGGYYMWSPDITWIDQGNRYVQSTIDLIDILDMRQFIDPVRESSLVSSGIFFNTADDFFFPLQELLQGDGFPGPLTKLKELGWVGDVPTEMIQWYLGQYRTNYPDLSSDERIDMLARYLAQAATRYQLKIKLRDNTWGNNFVQINFPQPVPGLPDALGNRRLHYRTLPMRMARTHMPPWRSKGFLCVRGAETTVKLSTWREKRDYNRLTVEFRNGEKSVLADADYVLG